MPRPGRLTPGKESRYPLYRRLGGPRASLDGCGKSRFHRDSIPWPFSPQRVSYPGPRYLTGTASYVQVTHFPSKIFCKSSPSPTARRCSSELLRRVLRHSVSLPRRKTNWRSTVQLANYPQSLNPNRMLRRDNKTVRVTNSTHCIPQNYIRSAQHNIKKGSSDCEVNFVTMLHFC